MKSTPVTPSSLIDEDRELSRYLRLSRQTMVLFIAITVASIVIALASMWLAMYFSGMGSSNVALLYNVLWGFCITASAYFGWRAGKIHGSRREALARHEVVLQILYG